MDSSTLSRILYAIVGIALVISVVTDLKWRLIKNVITFPTAIICLLIRGVFGGIGTIGGEGLLSGVLGLFLGWFVFWLINRKNSEALGGGDVKLMAAVGAGVGLPTILFCFVGTGLVGGIHAMALLIWRGEFFFTLKKMALKFIRSDAPMTKIRSTSIPYAPAIAIGSIWGVLWRLHSLSAVVSSGGGA